jgi:hypothetical protein
MMFCSSCCHLVVLTLHPFVFNLKGLATNTRRIQVLQDAFVLTLQSYFFFLLQQREETKHDFLLGEALLEEWLQAL